MKMKKIIKINNLTNSKLTINQLYFQYQVPTKIPSTHEHENLTS